MMKITETIERECCDFRHDIKPYKGVVKSNAKYKFCVHCGQIFESVRECDPAGSMETSWEKKVMP
jgi:hypothetical protein